MGEQPPQQQEREGSNGGDSYGVGEEAEQWLQNVLLAVADTQRQLAGGAKAATNRGRRNLG